MSDKKKALSILNEEFYKNINIISFIEKEEYKDIIFINNSIIIRLLNNGLFIYWDKGTDFTEIESYLSASDYKFYMLDKNVFDELKKSREIKWVVECEQFYLDDLSELPEPKMEVQSLGLDDAQFIYDNMEYQLGYTVDLIRERISHGPTSAIYKDDRLIAWAYTHDDGSLGGLNVIEEFRRQGYAKNICLDLIRKIIDYKGFTYLQVEKDNIKSKKLFNSLYFKKSHNIVWVGFKN